MIELEQLVKDFAFGLEQADHRRPEASNLRANRIYKAGIGPHTEAQTLKRVAEELAKLGGAYINYTFDVPYPGLSRQRCDWCIGSAPEWDWVIEAKLLRLFGDNAKMNDNMVTHILSPYSPHRSALTDCEKLAQSALKGRKAIIIFGYDYDGWDMIPIIEAFETLARQRVKLGHRHVGRFSDLVHPVHQRGGVFAWELTPN